MSAELISTDVLVIGGGLAGERCAIEAATAGHDVLILSLVPPRRSHSCAAQGGMQAALGNCVKAEGDNTTLHFLDTVRGSDWGADQEVARIFVEAVFTRQLAELFQTLFQLCQFLLPVPTESDAVDSKLQRFRIGVARRFDDHLPMPNSLRLVGNGLLQRTAALGLQIDVVPHRGLHPSSVVAGQVG